MSQRSEIKAELTSYGVKVEVDTPTPALAELLETARAIPRDEAGKIRKVARRAERFDG
jgi:hypothetical protein